MKIPDSLQGNIPDYMHISLKGKSVLYKSELMMLELLAGSNWERPLFMAYTVGPENHLGMGNHFMQEGLAYRFTPFDTEKLGCKINTEVMYDNLLHKFRFGGIDQPGIYIDENVMRMCFTHRRLFATLASHLIREGKNDMAMDTLDYAEAPSPSFKVPYAWQNGSDQMAEAYYKLGATEKADHIIDELANKSVEYMIWYLSMSPRQLAVCADNFLYNAGVLDQEVKLMEEHESVHAENYSHKFDQLYGEYLTRVKARR
jgi:hypothetical protein